MKKIVIFGGSGFLGNSLSKFLIQNNYSVVNISRSNSKTENVKNVLWDAENVSDWKNELNDSLAIINLVGKTVDCIKTPENCDLILRSRVRSTKLIGLALNEIQNPPKIWIQMSTAHIYGDPPKQKITEESAFGYGLAPFVGQKWEEMFLKVLPENTREIRMRTSFVIGKDGGALKTLKRITRLGLGGSSGKGTQGFSWLHEYDFNNFVLNAIEDNSYSGVYILSSPNPVSNKEFMKTLRKVLNIPFGLHSPEFIIRMGAKYLFKTDPELVLYGRYVYPKRLQDINFDFKFPLLKEALIDLK